MVIIRQGGSGYARKIIFENITLIAAGNPIMIDQYYCPHQKCSNQVRLEIFFLFF